MITTRYVTKKKPPETFPPKMWNLFLKAQLEVLKKLHLMKSRGENLINGGIKDARN